MQRWALTLSTYQYTIEHIKGTSNFMSRLPMTKQSRDCAKKIQTDDSPVAATQIAKESLRDSQLSIVMKAIQHGCWPTDSSVDVNPFYKRQHKLANYSRWLHFVGHKSCHSYKIFHEPLLKDLHCSHVGMSRMKSLARSYFRWP